jgi:small subunit ribosomal protein S6
MARRQYELVYILRPDISDDQVPEVMERVNQMLTSQGGVIQQEERWGRRRLAYPIRKYLEGTYIITQLELGPEQTELINRALHLSEDILRHLLVRKNGE